MFGSQLHTHGAGRAVETTLVGRDTAAETLVNRDPHYSTHFQVARPGPEHGDTADWCAQEIRALARPVRVLPGDALVTRCRYDTRDRANITLGGFGFSEEMCVDYVHYYPRWLHSVHSSASKSSIRRFVITEKAPTIAFSWLKAATTAFTFKTLLRHYAKRALTRRRP